ncbi:glycosyltransferase [Peijinzhouia sedimentorum]
MEKKVCLVVVTWNRIEILKDTIERLQGQTVPITTLVIVDNGSNDGTIEYIKRLKEIHSNIHSVLIPDNPGFGAGLAEGMKYGLAQIDHDFFWLMDDDSKPENDTLEKLINTIEEHNFDMLGLKGYNMVWGQPKIVKDDNVREVDYVLVDGAVIRGEVVKEVGVIGSHFFMMCEDYDYSKRLNKAGKRIGLLRTKYDQLHLGSEKFSKGTLWRGYYHSRNHLLILREYPSFKGYVGYIVRQSKYIVAAILFAPDRWRRAGLRIRGVFDALRSIKGKTIDPSKI